MKLQIYTPAAQRPWTAEYIFLWLVLPALGGYFAADTYLHAEPIVKQVSTAHLGSRVLVSEPVVDNYTEQEPIVDYRAAMPVDSIFRILEQLQLKVDAVAEQQAKQERTAARKQTKKPAAPKRIQPAEIKLSPPARKLYKCPVPTIFGVSRQQIEHYVNEHLQLAIEHENRYNIPREIKLAQALLESAAGTSKLAQQANNHFGIKYWGDKPWIHFPYPDDDKDDVFRRFKDVAGSYWWHSVKTLGAPRYKRCFECGDDWECWANELSRAGYATDPNYANKLIRAIGQLKLYEL